MSTNGKNCTIRKKIIKTLKKMRIYTHHSRFIAEIECKDAMSLCEIVTLNYDYSIDSHKMWMTKRQFEAALDGDQDTRKAIEMAYTDLVKRGMI